MDENGPPVAGEPSALVDGALEVRLRLLEKHLRSLSRAELISHLLAERRARVLDRRYFLVLLMKADSAVHGMPLDEWGQGDEGAEPDPLDEDELTELLGHRPTIDEVNHYLGQIEQRIDGPYQEEVIDWALQMPDR
jgi:hypothetical protein